MKIVNKVGGRALKYCILVLALLISSCANQQIVDEEKHSGFLKDYSKLSTVKLSSDRVVSQWVHSDFKTKQYTHLILDPVIFFPLPVAHEQVEREVLDEILSQMNNRVRAIAKKNGLPLVSERGPGVIRLKAAITAVDVEKEAFSVREVIPIRLVYSAAELAAGYRDSNVTFYLEYRITDSMSNEVLAIGVRKGDTQPLRNDFETLSLKHATTLLDDWGVDFDSGFLKFKNEFQLPE